METYPRGQHGRASLSSVNRGEVGEKEGSRRGNMARERWERARCTEETHGDRPTDAVDVTGL